MGLPPNWHGCWSSYWIAPLGSIWEQAKRRRRFPISHRPDPAAAEDKVKASVTAPITLNTLYSGSQWPYITSVWSWLDNGPPMFLCARPHRNTAESKSKRFLQGRISGEGAQTRYIYRWHLCSALMWPCTLKAPDNVKELWSSELMHLRNLMIEGWSIPILEYTQYSRIQVVMLHLKGLLLSQYPVLSCWTWLWS